MNLRRWGAVAATLAAAAFVGCEQSPTEKAQDEREEAVEAQQDAVDAQQNALEEQAEADAAARQAEGTSGDGGGPILTFPAPAGNDTDAGSAAPLSDEPEDVTAPSAEGADSGGATDATGQSASEPEDQPNEGDPQAGTQDGDT